MSQSTLAPRNRVNMKTAAGMLKGTPSAREYVRLYVTEDMLNRAFDNVRERFPDIKSDGMMNAS